MIRHVILWKLKDEFTPQRKYQISCDVKNALEALAGKIEGLEKLQVHIQLLESSNADMMLESVFSSKEALANYQKHPLHTAAADTFVRPFVKERLCGDFETCCAHCL